MCLYIQYKFHEIPSYGQGRKKLLKFRQLKGNNSSMTDATLMKLHMHNHIMVIHIQYKFHEIPSFGYKAMD